MAFSESKILIKKVWKVTWRVGENKKSTTIQVSFESKEKKRKKAFFFFLLKVRNEKRKSKKRKKTKQNSKNNEGRRRSFPSHFRSKSEKKEKEGQKQAKEKMLKEKEEGKLKKMEFCCRGLAAGTLFVELLIKNSVWHVLPEDIGPDLNR